MSAYVCERENKPYVENKCAPLHASMNTIQSIIVTVCVFRSSSRHQLVASLCVCVCVDG